MLSLFIFCQYYHTHSLNVRASPPPLRFSPDLRASPRPLTCILLLNLFLIGASWKRIIVNPAGREGFPDLSMSNPEDSTLLDLLKVQHFHGISYVSSPGVGGYSYLLEPLWWVGMITMIVGEIANFVAYAFAPTVLVTPLGALSIIVSAVLAQIILKEKLHSIGVLGCIMCIAGSIIIVIHAPKEQPIKSDLEIWSMATQLAGEHDFFPG
ncbi:hypothetical protein HN873_040568 [Arachis hypogaea]